MDLKTFFTSARNAVARDAGLNAWCLATFGRPLKVWADMPGDDFPAADDDYPFVLLTMPEKSSDQDLREVTYDLEAWLCFSLADYRATADANVTEPAGIELMCDMITQLKTALSAARPANSSIAVSELVDALGRPPEVNGYLSLHYRHRLSLGDGDPLLI